MIIRWMQTASLLIEDGGTRLAFDPFLCIPYQNPAYKVREFTRADAVLVTHGHFDHIHHLTRIYENGFVPVYCTRTPYYSLIRDGYERDMLRLIAPGWTRDFGRMRVTAYQSRHCQFDSALIARKLTAKNTRENAAQLTKLLRLNNDYPENSETLLYDIVSDVHVQIMGSLNLDENTVYPENADVLVLPFQGRSDVCEQGRIIVDRLKPKAVILDHFDDAFPPASEDVETGAFARLMAQRNIPCIVPAPFEPIDIKEIP